MRDNSKRVVYILPSPAKDHYVLYCSGDFNGKQVQMAKLVGRDPETNQEALENFQKFVKAKGLNQDILEPTQSETCSSRGD